MASDAHTPLVQAGAEFDALESEAPPSGLEATEPTAAKKKATTLQSLLNSVNILLGIGVLTVPFASSEGGWAAVALLVFLGFVTNYTAKLLWDLQRGPLPSDSGRRPSAKNAPPESMGKEEEQEEAIVLTCESYPELGELAFGTRGRACVGCALYAELFCALVLFILLLGTNLLLVLPEAQISERAFMAIATAALLPLCWLRTMKSLSWFSLFGVVSSVSLILSVAVYSFLGTCEGGANCSNVGHPSSESVSTQGLVQPGLPLSLGLLVVCFAGHSVFPSILYSMRTPADGPKLMNYTFLIATLLYAFLASVGYLWLGTSSPEQVTQLLPPGWVALIVTWLLLVGTYTKFALAFNPIADGFEQLLPCLKAPETNPCWLRCAGRTDSCRHNYGLALLQIAARTLLVGLALVIAVTIPCFGPLSSLVGAVLCVIISFFLPSLLYLKVRWRSLSKPVVGVNVSILVFSVVGAVAGAYASIADIVSCLEEYGNATVNGTADY